jgi:hypothetical protein
MMKNTILTFVACIVLFVGGCAVLDSVFIPKDGEIKSDTIKVVDGTVGGLAATGNPIAIPALAISSLLSVLAGVYTNLRKKQKLVEADDKYEQTRLITEAIVQAIEESAGVKVGDDDTLGNVVKAAVEEKLKDKDAYLVGKAIISALKGEV